jgi:hypothetical protein
MYVTPASLCQQGYELVNAPAEITDPAVKYAISLAANAS